MRRIAILLVLSAIPMLAIAGEQKEDCKTSQPCVLEVNSSVCATACGSSSQTAVLETRVYDLQNVSVAQAAAEIDKKLREKHHVKHSVHGVVVNSDVVIIPDEAANQLIVLSRGDYAERVCDLVAEVDRPREKHTVEIVITRKKDGKSVVVAKPKIITREGSPAQISWKSAGEEMSLQVVVNKVEDESLVTKKKSSASTASECAGSSCSESKSLAKLPGVVISGPHFLFEGNALRLSLSARKACSGGSCESTNDASSANSSAEKSSNKTISKWLRLVPLDAATDCSEKSNECSVNADKRSCTESANGNLTGLSGLDIKALFKNIGSHGCSSKACDTNSVAEKSCQSVKQVAAASKSECCSSSKSDCCAAEKTADSCPCVQNAKSAGCSKKESCSKAAKSLACGSKQGGCCTQSVAAKSKSTSASVKQVAGSSECSCCSSCKCESCGQGRIRQISSEAALELKSPPSAADCGNDAENDKCRDGEGCAVKKSACSRECSTAKCATSSCCKQRVIISASCENGRPATDEAKHIEKALSRRCSLHFENASLREVFRGIASAADVNVFVDSRCFDGGRVTSETPVSLDVENVTLRSALALILEPLNLQCEIKNEVLKISNASSREDRLETRTYQVGDFLHAAGPCHDGATSDLEDIANFIESLVEPQSWEQAGGPGSIRPFSHTQSLVIRHDQQTHHKIVEALSAIRSFRAADAFAHGQPTAPPAELEDVILPSPDETGAILPAGFESAPALISNRVLEDSVELLSVPPAPSEKWSTVAYENTNLPFPAQKLFELITTVVEPQSWQRHGGAGTISLGESSSFFIVHNTNDVQKKVRTLVSTVKDITASYVEEKEELLIGVEDGMVLWEESQDTRESTEIEEADLLFDPPQGADPQEWLDRVRQRRSAAGPVLFVR